VSIGVSTNPSRLGTAHRETQHPAHKSDLSFITHDCTCPQLLILVLLQRERASGSYSKQLLKVSGHHGSVPKLLRWSG
jgi:hypothetical protein